MNKGSMCVGESKDAIYNEKMAWKRSPSFQVTSSTVEHEANNIVLLIITAK